MFLNVVAFSILKENNSGLINLLLINSMLGWYLYLLIGFIMGSVMSLCSSIIYGFSFICRRFVVFFKKLFSFSDTKCSSNITFSFSSTRAILFLIFLYSENKGCIFFQTNLLSETFFVFILSTFALRSHYAPNLTYYYNFFVSFSLLS